MKTTNQSQTFEDWRARLERQKQMEYFDPQAEINILRHLIQTLENNKTKGI